MGVQPININSVGLLWRYAQNTCLFWQTENQEGCPTEMGREGGFLLSAKSSWTGPCKPLLRNTLGRCFSSRGKNPQPTDICHGQRDQEVGAWWHVLPLPSSILNAKQSSSSKPMDLMPLFQAVMPSNEQYRWALSWGSAKGADCSYYYA